MRWCALLLAAAAISQATAAQAQSDSIRDRSPVPGETERRHELESLERLSRRLLSSTLAERRLDSTMDQLRDRMRIDGGARVVARAADEASPVVRQRLIDELADLGTPEAFGAIALLGARHEDVRGHAVEAFVSRADAMSIEEASIELALQLRGENVPAVNAAAAFTLEAGLVELLPQLATSLVEVEITGRPRIPFSGACDDGIYPFLINTSDVRTVRLHRVQIIDATGDRIENTFEYPLPRGRDFASYEYLLGCDRFGGVLVNVAGEPDLRFAVDRGDELVLMEGEARVSYRPAVKESLVELAGAFGKTVPDLGYDETAWLAWIDRVEAELALEAAAESAPEGDD